MRNKKLIGLLMALILVLTMSTASLAATGPSPTPTPTPAPNPYFGFEYTYIGSEGIGAITYGKNDFESMTNSVSYDVVSGSTFGAVNGGAYDKLPKDAEEISLVLWVPMDGVGFMDEPYRFIKVDVSDEKADNFVILSPSYDRLYGYDWSQAYIDIQGGNLLLKSYTKRNIRQWGSAGSMIQIKFWVW